VNDGRRDGSWLFWEKVTFKQEKMSSDLSEILGIVAVGAMMIILTVEMILSATWNKTYFSFGLTLFEVNIPVNFHHVNIPPKSVFETQLRSVWLGSIAFREISHNTYGFREKLFQFRLMRYSPVMHGLLIFDDVNSQVIVKGFANWFLLVFSLIWLSEVILWLFSGMIMALAFLAFFILLMSLLYAIQYPRFVKIANIASEAWSRKYASNITGM
jgi:hypothetical protein